MRNVQCSMSNAIKESKYWYWDRVMVCTLEVNCISSKASSLCHSYSIRNELRLGLGVGVSWVESLVNRCTPCFKTIPVWTSSSFLFFSFSCVCTHYLQIMFISKRPAMMKYILVMAFYGLSFCIWRPYRNVLPNFKFYIPFNKPAHPPEEVGCKMTKKVYLFEYSISRSFLIHLPSKIGYLVGVLSANTSTERTLTFQSTWSKFKSCGPTSILYLFQQWVAQSVNQMVGRGAGGVEEMGEGGSAL